MFANLASPDGEKDRSYRHIGNKVSSSPFLSTASPQVASTNNRFSPSPFSSSSPNVALSNQKEKKHTEEKNNMDWPDEDGIPAPGASKQNSTEHNVGPITLSTSKFSTSSSPFQVINNKDIQGRVPNFDSNKSKLEAACSPLKTLNLKEQRFEPQGTVTIDSISKIQNKIEPSSLSEKKAIDTPIDTNDPSQESSTSNHNENKLLTNGNNRNKSTRSMRLQKARRSTPSPIVANSLKQSLQAANVVMQEEKSDAGASDASSRSSLTNKELSDIAKRALSSQEARRALLSVTASKQKGTIEGIAVSERLGVKANRAVAMKNSSRGKAAESSQNGLDIVKTLSTYSHDSSRSRRMEHPAFAGRPAKTNISTAHILASYKQLNAARQSLPSKQKGVTSNSNAKNKFENRFEQTFLDDDSFCSRSSMESLEQEETMHSVREMIGESMQKMPGESMRSMSERQGESMHSMSGRQGRSMHSNSGRKYAGQFNRVGRIHVTSKNNCNDTVVSSLSGNTQSLQSITSKMMSPTNKNYQKTPFHLDPMPEHSSQTIKSELVGMLSPGPSNRSGHSVANSIISASPRADYRSPSLRGPVNTSFMGTLEEKLSSGQESAGNSAELLDTAVEAAIEDMEILDSPRTNPSYFVESDNDCLSKDISTLPSSYSGRSHSPPGFVFNDSEESDVIVPPDPVGKGFALENTIDGEEDNNSISSNGESENSDRSEKQEISEVKASVDDIYQKQGSSSTKQTVSTSIRSGVSSIQNSPHVEITKSDSGFDVVDRETYEGSTSIRTGLSGIQSRKDSNDLENSISINSNKNAIIQNSETSPTAQRKDKETVKNEESGRYPDTINEENEVKSTQKSTASLKDENSFFSGLKVRPTATTDGSSGTTTGGSFSDQMSSDPSGNDSGMNAVNANGNILPPIQSEEDAEISSSAFSMLAPGSRRSRPRKNKLGESIGNAIKLVLTKASSKGSGKVSTNFSQSKREENEECGSLFSLDDDDIFGGLEVEQDVKVFKSVTPRKQKIDEITPRLKNFTSNEKKDGSISRRTNGSLSYRANESLSRRSNESLSRRANESFSRRANGSLSRRTNESNLRKSIETGSNRKIHMNGMLHSGAVKKPPNTPSQQHNRTGSSPSTPVVTVASLYPNDRSGMIVNESDVLHNVNSDITSSLISGPVSGQSPFKKTMREASKLIEKEVFVEMPESQYVKEETGESFTLLMEETDTSLVEQKAPESSNDGKFEPKEEETTVTPEVEDEEEDKGVGSMFLNFGCGLVDDPCSGFVSLCTQENKVDDDAEEERVVGGVSGDKDSGSVGSSSRLSPNNTNKSTNEDKKDNYDVKREAARDKLLDIANAALSSQVSVKSTKSTLIEDDQCTKTTISEGSTLSASGSSESESGFTKETESGASGSGNSSGNSHTSGESLGSFSQGSSRGTYSSASYSSVEESDAILNNRSRSRNTKAITPTAGPILLSFSQRSLMEKFSKQLTAVGVQVLKLNTRKQWQTRYFTVSTEQIALSAHEAISKTGEIAQCPKALLWLKKFNPKNGGYSIINIDKNGHGGTLLVDLVDIQVSDRKDDMQGNPIPKKLQDVFEKSVLVTLKYKMKGILRSIEFRCRDNDEAQFLCTCMRVIRDLLRRERSLRQKLSKQVSNKEKSRSSSRGR